MSGQPPSGLPRDRDSSGRPRSARPRDALGRPLPRSAEQPGGPPREPPPLPPQQALDRAQELLDAGQSFEAHEVLEAVWKAPATPEEDRQLWRALAQLAVGITHARRGNRQGAAALLRRAAQNLAPFADTSPHLVDVDGLLAWAEASATSVESAVGRGADAARTQVDGMSPRLRPETSQP